jgi:hypothetical protein
MPAYSHSIGATRFNFDDLKTLLARATPGIAPHFRAANREGAS